MTIFRLLCLLRWAGVDKPLRKVWRAFRSRPLFCANCESVFRSIMNVEAGAVVEQSNSLMVCWSIAALSCAYDNGLITAERYAECLSQTRKEVKARVNNETP